MPKKSKQRSCTEPDCKDKHLAKGLCAKHYSESRRRKDGIKERGEPKPHHIEFLASTDLRARFFAAVPERQRSEVLRRALEAELMKINEEGVGP